jgi:hypothetical protein
MDRKPSSDDFFKDIFSKEFLQESDVEYALAKVAGGAYNVKQESGLSFRKIATKMGLKSPSVIQRMVRQAQPHNVTLETLVRFAYACGFELNIEFRKVSQPTDPEPEKEKQ